VHIFAIDNYLNTTIHERVGMFIKYKKVFRITFKY